MSLNLYDLLAQARQVLEQRKADYWLQLGAVSVLENLIKDQESKDSGPAANGEEEENGDSGKHRQELESDGEPKPTSTGGDFTIGPRDSTGDSESEPNFCNRP